MESTITVGRVRIAVRENVIDRVIRYFDPVTGLRRFQARTVAAIAGGYNAGKRSRRATERWSTRRADADADILWDIQTMRDRSRDLVRNAPLATGALNTICTNVVGSGLKLQAQIDHRALGMTEEKADDWEEKAEREFKLWARSKDCDIERALTFYEMQELVFRSTLESGDTFVLLPSVKRPTSPFSLKLQAIEADRVCNPNNKADTTTLAGGVEKDKHGAPIAYHIMTHHPGAIRAGIKREWKPVPAFGSQTGRRNVLHLYRKIRIGQTRGVPYLAPVIEPLKQLDRYTEAEIMAAVVSAMFTIFVKTPSGEDGLPTQATGGISGVASDDAEKLELGNGAIVSLADGETIDTANPGRPNTAFDPFMMAILRQVGVALELPFEVLIKHFTASYSAARAAMLEAWKFYTARRTWQAVNFCQPVYETFMDEAVALGRVPAPGYFQNPLIRAAYCGALWIGPGKGMIDEKKEIEAAKGKAELGISTLSELTAELTGGDWEDKHRRAARERRTMNSAGMKHPADKDAAPAAIAAAEYPNEDNPE